MKMSLYSGSIHATIEVLLQLIKKQINNHFLSTVKMHTESKSTLEGILGDY